MMRAILYRPLPADNTSGEILAAFQGSPINLGVNLAAMTPVAFIDLTAADLSDGDFHALTATHRVQGGDLVPLQS